MCLADTPVCLSSDNHAQIYEKQPTMMKQICNYHPTFIPASNKQPVLFYFVHFICMVALRLQQQWQPSKRSLFSFSNDWILWFFGPTAYRHAFFGSWSSSVSTQTTFKRASILKIGKYKILDVKKEHSLQIQTICFCSFVLVTVRFTNPVAPFS